MEKVYKNDLSKHLSFAEKIILPLRKEILESTLTGGTPLKQDMLAQRFGVSISALREALKVLEGEGLVEFVPNKGAFVKRLNADEAREIFDIRALIEAEAMNQSMELLTEEDFAAIDKILDEEEHCFDPVRYSDLNMRFHEELYKHCPNQHLRTMIRTLHANVSRYMTLYLDKMLHKELSQCEHRKLAEACRAKNKRLAKSVIKRHMERAGKELADYLHKHPEL